MSTERIARQLIKVCMVAVIISAFTGLAYGAASASLSERERAQKLTVQGVADFKAGNAEQGRKTLEQAISIDATVYEAHFWLGRYFAQKAGSSTEARRKAIECFRSAVALQPYGDEGDLIRSWLIKLTGRPKSVVIVPLRVYGKDGYDSQETDEITQRLSAEAQQAGFTVEIPKRNYNDSQRTLPQKADLKELALNPDGTPRAGWVVFIGAGNLKLKYDKKRGYIGRGTADMWIGDAVSYLLYPKATISSSSLGLLDLVFKDKKNSIDAREDALDSLASLMWDKFRRVAATENESKPLDEILIPTAVSGIYARSTARSVQEAAERETVAVYSLDPDGEMEQETSRKICAGVQRHILTRCNLNCISPSYTKSLAANLSDDVRQAATDIMTNTEAEYALAIRFEQLDVKVKDELLSKRVIADFKARAAITSADKGLLWSGSVTATEKKTILLASEVIDVQTRLRAAAINKLLTSLNERLTGVLGKGQKGSNVRQ